MTSYLLQSSPHLNSNLRDEILTEKVAVLFTDIVGSTEFFKIYGDEHGREMLKHHYSLVSMILNRYNGHIIKFIGDSIMAYFREPHDALRAAINLQQKIHAYNKNRATQPVRVRIGIHFGDVIIEKEDIYGDVVNIASKLTDLAEGDMILISHELFLKIKDTPHMHFKMIEKGQKNIPEGITAFYVSWDEELLLDRENVVFFIHPVLPVSTQGFNIFWNDFIENLKISLKDRIKTQKTLDDNTFVMYLKDPLLTVDCAKTVMDILLMKKEPVKDLGILPIQFVIDVDPYFFKDPEFKEEWKENIKPGVINISEEAYIVAYNSNFDSFEKIPVKFNRKKFYHLLYPPCEKNVEVEPFCYGFNFTDGPHRLCFYCGSKRHREKDCPTKYLSGTTRATEKLGYFSFEKINKIFFKLALSGAFDKQLNSASEHENDSRIAYEAFFEPSKVFQIGFFQSIWSCKEQGWQVAKKNANGIKDGGIIWLSLDSLRVSDYCNVEKCLKSSVEVAPDNFRVDCIYGLLNIEKNDLSNAEKHLKQAISKAKGKIYNTFLNLLYARLFFIENKFDEALKAVNSIIFHDPLCLDAYYFRVKIELYMGRYKKAMADMINLIKENRDYFIYTYIDAELFPFRGLIAETLNNIFKSVKNDAVELVKGIDRDFSETKGFMDAQTVSQIEAILFKIKGLIKEDSYFGYLDIIGLSNEVLLKMNMAKEEEKNKLKSKLMALSERAKRGIMQSERLIYKRLTHGYREELDGVSKKIESLINSIDISSFGELNVLKTTVEKIGKELYQVEEKLEKIAFLDIVLQSTNTFIKNICLSFAVVFLISIVILPALSHYLNFILQRFGIDLHFESWEYKKYTFISGGIIGFAYSIFTSLKKILFRKTYCP